MDFQYERPTFDLNGVTFQFKKSSPANTQEVLEYQQELYQEFMDAESPDEIPEDANIDSMKGMIRRIADPVEHDSVDEAFSQIDWQHVDNKKVQAAMRYFLE